MGLGTWIAVAVIVLVVIGLGVGVFFSGLIRGAEIIWQNPAVQNASEKAQEFVGERIGSQISSDVLIVTTNEAVYKIGEPVVITVKNNGDSALAFPDASMGLEIENINTGEKYDVAAAQVVTELEPGQSKAVTWNQQDGKGSNAPAGDYNATVHTMPSGESISAQVDFQITG